MSEHEPDWLRYGAPIDLANPTDSRAIILGMVPDAIDVLELGCSVGYMTRVLRERGSRIVGVEVDPEAARHAEPHLERLIVGDLDTEPLLDDLAPGSFDLVLAADVLEHLRDPAGCLRSLLPLLKPDGSILVSVPNVAHVDVRLELLEGRFGYRDNGLLDRTHLQMFTLPTLTDLLDSVGLVPVRWRPNRRPLATTEIAVDEQLQAFGECVVAADGDAEVYQWIVVCRPAGTVTEAAVPDAPDNRVAAELGAMTTAASAPVPRAVDDVGTVELAGLLLRRVVTGVPRRMARLVRRVAGRR